MGVNRVSEILYNNNIQFAIKTGLAAGAIYFVSEQGVWKDSETTSKLTKKICTNVSPYTQQVKKQLPFELPSLPPRTELSYMLKYYWNKAVLASFAFLANVPAYVGDLSSKGVSSVMDSAEIKNLFVSSADTADTTK